MSYSAKLIYEQNIIFVKFDITTDISTDISTESLS